MANLRSVKPGPPTGGNGDGGGERAPLDAGTTIVEVSSGREARIVEHACQYAHPQAAPVFQYLVRWDDGQVEAVSEGAFRRGGGLEVVRDGADGD